MAVLIFALFSTRWQHQTIKATPKDVYHLTSTLKGLVPGATVDPKPDPEFMSEKPVALFHLYAGLFYVSVAELCDPPTDVFDKLIDRKACRERLALFCEDLEEKMPDDNLMVEAVEKAYKNCVDRMKHTDGISIPLLSGPEDDVAMPQKKGASATASFEAELDLDASDYDVDFCVTVADCDKLEGLRSWSFTLMALLMSAIGVAVVAEVLLLLHIAAPAQKAGSYGCPVLLLVLPFVITVVGLYIYVDGQYPVEKLVRTEDLFYFIMPPSIDVGFPRGAAAQQSLLALAQQEGHEPIASVLQLGGRRLQHDRLRPYHNDHSHYHRYPDHRHYRHHRDHHNLNSYQESLPAAVLPPDSPTVVPSLNNPQLFPSSGDQVEAELFSISPSGRFGRLGRRWNPRWMSAALDADANGTVSLTSKSAASITELQHNIHSVTHSRGLGQEVIPHARAQSTMVTLTGNMVNAVMTGDLTKLMELLAEAVGRAMQLCETLLENWDGYLKSKLLSSGSAAGPVGQGLLTAVVNGFDKSEDMLLLALALCTATKQSCQQPVEKILKVKETLSQLKDRAKDQVTGVLRLLKACLESVQGVMKIWTAIKEPAWRIIQRAKDMIGKSKNAGADPVGLMLSAATTVLDPQTMSDIQTLMAQLFTAFPRIMVQFKTLAQHFVIFGKNMTSFFNDARLNMMDVAGLNLDKDKSLVGVAASQHEASTFWTGKGSPGSALMEMSAGGPTWEVAMGPLAQGSMGNLAAKVGAIFLREIEHMETRKGLVSSKQWSKCDVSDPSSCLHFGTAFTLLLAVSCCLSIGAIGFGCKCC